MHDSCSMSHWYESFVWVFNETFKSREDAADVVANVLSRSLTLDDEDVEIDIDVSESRIDDVGTVLNRFIHFRLWRKSPISLVPKFFQVSFRKTPKNQKPLIGREWFQYNNFHRLENCDNETQSGAQSFMLRLPEFFDNVIK